MHSTPATVKKIVIIGGGFAGLSVAKGLRRLHADITLIDQSNHHLFQPLLYQVATASLSPADIAAPLRHILSDCSHINVIMAEVVSIDKVLSHVVTKKGLVFPFDYLVVATGSRHSYFGKNHWESLAPGLKTLQDALTIREKILLAFEQAETASNPDLQRRLLTFVVVGGGPTGVEMAGAIAEIAKQTIKDDFKHIKPASTRILLIESSGAVLNRYPPSLREAAQKSLEALGVEVLLNKMVTDMRKGAVQLNHEWVEAHTIIWAAGNTAPSFLTTLDVPLEKSGQVIVQADLSLVDYPHICVIGDCAKALDRSNNPLPATSPVAIQQGQYVAKIIRGEPWKKGRPLFRYFDKGSMATIGRGQAVASILSFQFTGFFAWILWSLTHIFFLINFRAKVLVMLNWAWSYLRAYRGVRLIVHNTNDNDIVFDD